MRPRQWVKNSIVFFALIFDKQLFHAEALLRTFAGFALFSLVASTVYIFNDIADIREKYFPKDGPSSVICEVSALAWPEFMIEIEAVAVVS